MITYIKQIVKWKLKGKDLPGVAGLVRQHPLYERYLSNRDVLVNAVPWITFSAKEYLEHHLSSEMKVFEFGGGGSTLFFASRVKQLVTVEHDAEWYKMLCEKMEEQKDVQWTGLSIQPVHDPESSRHDPANPLHYSSTDPAFQNHSFKDYASAIDKYPDRFFDVVVVDGRARPSCIRHGVPKTRLGGLLVLDNADRSYYLEQTENELVDFKLVCKDYGPTPYSIAFTQTNIYKRIK